MLMMLSVISEKEYFAYRSVAYYYGNAYFGLAEKEIN